MIRFSCSDYTFPQLPRAKRFALLQLLGFKYVDIGLFERSPDLRPAQLLASPAAFTKKLQSDLKQSGLQASDIFLQTGEDPAVSAANDSSPTVRSRNRKTFLRALDLCTSLGCIHLTGLPGVWHKGTRKADDLALAIEEACWRQHAAANVGLTYAIEAHVGSICADIASTRAFLDHVPGLTLTLDYGHFVSAGIDTRDVHSLVTFASHIHARGGAHNRLQASVRENTIDFAGMIQHLRKQKYNGFIAIEYVWANWMECDRTDNVSETLLLHHQLMKSIKLNPHQNLK